LTVAPVEGEQTFPPREGEGGAGKQDGEETLSAEGSAETEERDWQYGLPYAIFPTGSPFNVPSMTTRIAPLDHICTGSAFFGICTYR
jgi:hypothetical protein